MELINLNIPAPPSALAQWVATAILAALVVGATVFAVEFVDKKETGSKRRTYVAVAALSIAVVFVVVQMLLVKKF